MFSITMFDCNDGPESFYFDSVEEAEYALERLYDAEENSTTLDRRLAILSLEEQLSAHRMALECSES